MRLLVFAVPTVLLFAFSKPNNTSGRFFKMPDDSGHITHITHTLDGATTEWPDSLFQSSKESLLHYAEDNDAQNLYIAVRIADFRTQMKLMHRGMKLFIDTKGKKKEGKGIEFPIKPESGDNYMPPPIATQHENPQSGDKNAQPRSFDKKQARAAMSLHLFSMKLFGLTDSEDSQGLQVEGSANIAFTWDTSDVMHIEYVIPLSLLGDANSLKQKTISVGWKINGMAYGGGSNNAVGYSSNMQGRPSGAGGGGRGGRGAGPSNPSGSPEMQHTTEEESVWTKYTLNL